VQSQSSFATEALAQAAGNVVLAHLVSLAFLTVLTRKIVGAYEKVRGSCHLPPAMSAVGTAPWFRVACKFLLW
jgi:hypothetical protein